MLKEEGQNFVEKWIGKNPNLVMAAVAVALIIYGVLSMIGALKNWDWLYEPDTQFSGNPLQQWSPGKISYEYGRKAGRLYGFLIGLLIFIPLGAFLGFLALR